MPQHSRNMTAALANDIFDVLVAHAGASERLRGSFVHTQTRDAEVCAEFRFQGSLGFGGKFWRNPSYSGPGWYVNAYQEDEGRPGVRECIEATNEQLAVIEAREGGAF